jgi:phosphoglycolate phosphatase
MTKAKPYELLIFDWDGTLMDSHARIVACLQGAANDVAAAPLAAEAARNIIGLGLGEAIRALYPDADAVFVERFTAAYRERFLGDGEAPEAMFDGAHEVLDALERNGYLLAVATGKGRAGLDRVLAQAGLMSRFHVTRCADETFSKPHPAMLEQILEFTGVDPAQALMIGDTTYDLEMAHNAGVDSLGVSYGAHPPEVLAQWRPQAILERIDVLPGWLLEHDRRHPAQAASQP